MILKANCKINLGLDILRRRADGFHDLETVMFPVAGLYDEVEVVRTAAPGAEFRAEGLAVDCAPEDNICVKAFRLMQRRYGVDGVAIRLDKRVPFGAGLGGGSSDGTAVLLEEVGRVIAEGGVGVTISSQSGWRMPALTAEQERRFLEFVSPVIDFHVSTCRIYYFFQRTDLSV